MRVSISYSVEVDGDLTDVQRAKIAHQRVMAGAAECTSASVHHPTPDGRPDLHFVHGIDVEHVG